MSRESRGANRRQAGVGADVYCIIGYPIAHSISPAIYNAAFPVMGIAARFEAWAVPPEEVASAVGRLRAGEALGMMVTVPHKQRVMPLLDDVDPEARAAGAVNCIVRRDGRLVGNNTDVYGFRRSLQEAGLDATGVKAVVLGAGGAAHAVAYGLAQSGAAEVTFANRTSARAHEAVQHLRSALDAGVRLAVCSLDVSELRPVCEAADLIVNCTSVGMRHGEAEARSPLDPSLLRPGLWVYDTVYTPARTPLLRQAEAAGARTVAGLEMLIYQAVRAIELWLDREAPVDVMRSAARAALGLED